MKPSKFPILPVDVTPTAQQVFDAVRQHAKTMPGRSMSNPSDLSSGCVYRTSDGSNACFVGALLTDAEVFDNELDDRGNVYTANDLTNSGKMPARLVEHTALLQSLQDIHDQNRDRRAWPREFRELAARIGLSF